LAVLIASEDLSLVGWIDIKLIIFIYQR